MEHSASRSWNTRYDSVLLQASSQDTPVSAVVYAAADWWLSIIAGPITQPIYPVYLHETFSECSRENAESANLKTICFF